MNNIFLFNPENDLALAFGGENYTAPPFAAQLKSDLQVLPVWYANGSPVLVDPSRIPQSWLHKIAQVVPVSFMSTQQAADTAAASPASLQVSPWGWNAALRRQLMRQFQFSESQLPSPAQVEAMRQLSHRRTSISIMQQCSQFFPCPPLPEEKTSLPDALAFAQVHPDCFFKSPWSSSGHGVFHVFNLEASDFKEWCTGILRRQKSVLCETALQPSLEFGVEFLSKNGKIEICGFSVFNNDSHQQLSSALVAPHSHLHHTIASAYPDFDQAAGFLTEKVLPAIVAPVYSGFFGIDMMLYTDSSDNSIRLNPCVELNLRPTFGLVTSSIGQHFLHPGSLGQFHFEYHPQANCTPVDNLVVKDGKFYSGRLYLAPVSPQSQFIAYVDISPATGTA